MMTWRCRGIVAAALAAAACGCRPSPPPAANIGFHLSSSSDVERLGRVVFVELDYEPSHVAQAGQMTSALHLAIQSRHLFHIGVVRRDAPVCRDLPLAKREPLTLGELSALREALRCDAVLLGRLVSFHPHPRMQVGLYLNLLDLRDGKVVWALEHIWDTADRSMEARLRWFSRTKLRRGYEPADWRLATMSPSLFAKFVAEEAADTLMPPPPAPRPQEEARAPVNTDERGYEKEHDVR